MERAAANNNAVSVDEYMELHQVASKLEGELLMHKSSSNVDQLSQELRLRTKAIKALVGLLLLAIFTPGLFYVVFVLALGMLGLFYYLEMEPYKHQIDEVIVRLAHLFSSVTEDSVGQARNRLQQKARAKQLKR